MNIISALMKEDCRLTYFDRWLVFDNITEEWVVYERKYSAKKTKEIGRTVLQEGGIELLLEKK